MLPSVADMSAGGCANTRGEGGTRWRTAALGTTPMQRRSATDCPRPPCYMCQLWSRRGEGGGPHCGRTRSSSRLCMHGACIHATPAHLRATAAPRPSHAPSTMRPPTCMGHASMRQPPTCAPPRPPVPRMRLPLCTWRRMAPVARGGLRRGRTTVA
jgi:hypothetical protein